jgi:hypothetical protein
VLLRQPGENRKKSSHFPRLDDRISLNITQKLWLFFPLFFRELSTFSTRFSTSKAENPLANHGFARGFFLFVDKYGILQNRPLCLHNALEFHLGGKHPITRIHRVAIDAVAVQI